MAKEAAAPTRDMGWRINLPDGTVSEESGGLLRRLWSGSKGLAQGSAWKIRKFLEKAWSTAVAEPCTVIHAIKLGLAVTLVSLFYNMRPFYNGSGGNAMLAVVTVVVVFEYTVGATLAKCINRAVGTFLAVILGVGVNWVANLSGAEFEAAVLGISLFILAAAGTFLRFIPSVKTRYDYGAVIFVMTFSLVAVSGYGVDELFELVGQRLSTVAVGTSLCIIISMLFCPIWAGVELHNLIINNLEKLADSLDGCVSDYFKDENEDGESMTPGYEFVLNSKATEETMANFAWWEPTHGRFNFGHPWKTYLIIGTSLRSCAYCIEILNVSVNSDIKTPEHLKTHLQYASKTLSSQCSAILRELAAAVRMNERSSKIQVLIGDMNVAVQELRNVLQSLPRHVIGELSGTAPLVGMVPLVTVASTLIETAARIEICVDAVEKLAKVADFKVSCTDISKSSGIQPTNRTLGPHSDRHYAINQEDETIKAFPQV